MICSKDKWKDILNGTVEKIVVRLPVCLVKINILQIYKYVTGYLSGWLSCLPISSFVWRNECLRRVVSLKLKPQSVMSYRVVFRYVGRSRFCH